MRSEDGELGEVCVRCESKVSERGRGEGNEGEGVRERERRGMRGARWGNEIGVCE